MNLKIQKQKSEYLKSRQNSFLRDCMTTLVVLLVIFFPFIFPTISFAHAFGQQYTLPVPFWLYAYGAGAAVIVSFLVIGFFLKDPVMSLFYPRRDISSSFLFTIVRNKLFLICVKCISVILLFFTIISGLTGSQDPQSNFSMTFFWILCVLGITYVSAIIGNIYGVLNPWKAIIDFFEFVRQDKNPVMLYPKKLGVYPAIIFYLCFLWIELIGKFIPFELSGALIVYTFITLLGALLFGKKDWFLYCEFFSVFYRLIGNIGIIVSQEQRLYLRPPFVGLLEEKADSFSFVLFVLLMLSSTAYDGFRETRIWWNIYFAIAQSFNSPLISKLPDIMGTVGLLFFPLLFLSVYLFLLYFMKLIIKTDRSLLELSLVFVFSLIPIAFVYNIAHYFTLFLIQGQSSIALLSDPMGWGLNLFGTKNVVPNVGIISASVIWHLQVGFIIFGHIVAVYLAHIISLHIFKASKAAIMSQLPMVLLMVIYTITGLWILSQPLSAGF